MFELFRPISLIMIIQYSLRRDAVLAASVCGLVLWGQKSALWVVSRLISSPLQQRRKVLALHKNSHRFPSLWGKRIWRRGILTLLPCKDSGSHESRVLVNIYFFIYADADLGEPILLFPTQDNDWGARGQFASWSTSIAVLSCSRVCFLFSHGFPLQNSLFFA